jgi:chemotaxis protein histidine kinase CheA
MKREDITSIFPEATKEQIDKLMGINGNDINKAKADTETLTTQLAAARSEIETLKANSNADELEQTKQLASSLQTELDGMKAKDALRQIREKVSKATKVPADLLTGETEEACTAQANSILEFAKPTYPRVPDGGEVGASTTLETATRDKFAEWAKENL